MIITIQQIEAALNIRSFDGLDAQMQMAPRERHTMRASPDKPARPSAVLILLYPHPDTGLNIILTKRTDNLRGHSGQVSFPGGRRDPHDNSYEATALRETCEELGICQQTHINLLGRLTTMWIPPSNFEVVPVLATIKHQPVMQPNPAEVARVLHFPLQHLLDDSFKRSKPMRLRGWTMDVPYYDVDGCVVWGATAGMLSELEQRLWQVLP